MNLRAYLAMSRLNADVIMRLVELLRSDAPLSPLVRNAMADAFEAKNPERHVLFEICRKKAGPLGDYGERRKKFHRDMEIARFIGNERSPPHNMNLEDAAEAAELAFGIGVKTCKEAVLKHRRMELWMREKYPEIPLLMNLLPAGNYLHLMEVEYHYLLEEGCIEGSAGFG